MHATLQVHKTTFNSVDVSRAFMEDICEKHT